MVSSGATQSLSVLALPHSFMCCLFPRRWSVNKLNKCSRCSVTLGLFWEEGGRICFGKTQHAVRSRIEKAEPVIRVIERKTSTGFVPQLRNFSMRWRMHFLISKCSGAAPITLGINGSGLRMGWGWGGIMYEALCAAFQKSLSRMCHCCLNTCLACFLQDGARGFPARKETCTQCLWEHSCLLQWPAEQSMASSATVSTRTTARQPRCRHR